MRQGRGQGRAGARGRNTENRKQSTSNESRGPRNGKSRFSDKKRDERTSSDNRKQSTLNESRGPRNGKSRFSDKKRDERTSPDNKSRRYGNRPNFSPKKEELGSEETDQLLSKSGSIYRKNRTFSDKLKKSYNNPSSKVNDGSIRLNRFIANAGICSRRDADTYIESGVVTINGKVVTELGTRVQPGDEVNFEGRKLVSEKKQYILLNKPKGYVTTVEDPNAEKTVIDLVKNACQERIYPVGRLDKATTGLLLLTNDGDLTKKLTHPKYNRKKIYHVFCDKRVAKKDVDRILEGITLEDGFVQADSVGYVDPEDPKQIGIEIHSGKNHIVRRIFAHLGYKVVKLDRVYFCGLTKKNLPRGKWRFLTAQEINLLRMGNF